MKQWKVKSGGTGETVLQLLTDKPEVLQSNARSWPRCLLQHGAAHYLSPSTPPPLWAPSGPVDAFKSADSRTAHATSMRSAFHFKTKVAGSGSIGRNQPGHPGKSRIFRKEVSYSIIPDFPAVKNSIEALHDPDLRTAPILTDFQRIL